MRGKHVEIAGQSFQSLLHAEMQSSWLIALGLTDGKRHVVQASGRAAATVYACGKIANMTMMSLQPRQYPHTSMIQLMW